jgi:3D-(3,5/4)-trihydroxycyclohexane-1,2-dione acylhydrolase (decyclizing)
MLPSDADGNDVVRLPVHLAENARSLGADVIECRTYTDLVAGIAQARKNSNTTVVYIRNDRYQGVPGYESWWDVPPAEVSTSADVQAKRVDWATKRATEKDYL